jgi:hypothetical protein
MAVDRQREVVGSLPDRKLPIVSHQSHDIALRAKTGTKFAPNGPILDSLVTGGS